MELPYEKALSIKEFAKSRLQDNDTVATWIRRHPEVDACCKMLGKEKYIDMDSEGYELLNRQYPYQKPVPAEETAITAELVRALKELNEEKDKVETLQKAVFNYELQLRENGSVQYLLEAREQEIEDKNRQLVEQKEQADAVLAAVKEAHGQALMSAENREKEAREKANQERIRAEEAERKLAEMEQKAAEAEAQVASMKQAGFFARIFKKGW